jgi:hypothetical protein
MRPVARDRQAATGCGGQTGGGARRRDPHMGRQMHPGWTMFGADRALVRRAEATRFRGLLTFFEIGRCGFGGVLRARRKPQHASPQFLGR